MHELKELEEIVQTKGSELRKLKKQLDNIYDSISGKQNSCMYCGTDFIHLLSLQINKSS